MVTNTNLEVLVPLTILVSLGISRVCRTVDPTEYLGIAGWEFHPFDWPPTPNLGVLTYLHMGNNAIMFITFTVILGGFRENILELYFGAGKDLTTLMLAFITGVVWLLLPLLSFDEYMYIPPSSKFSHPESFNRHFISTTTIMILSIITEILYRISGTPNSLSDVGILRVLALIPMAISLGVVVVGPLWVLNAFESELKKTIDT